MSEQICVCTRERDIVELQERVKEISELKQRVKELEVSHRGDHELLVRLDEKFDIKLDVVSEAIATLTAKVDELKSQPADRYEKFKYAIGATVITAIVGYIVNLILN